MIRLALLGLSLFLSAQALSWEGTDEEGNDVEIGKGNLVRRGRDIEYDRDGETVSATVDSIRSTWRTVEIEVTDEDGESHTLEMERR